MAQETEQQPLSDTEGERTARENLKKTHLTSTTSHAESLSTTTETAVNDDSNGRLTPAVPTQTLQRKRSHEEIDADAQDVASVQPQRHHARKRSRDSTAEEQELNNGSRKSGERARNGADEATENASEQTVTNGIERASTPELADQRGPTVDVTSPKTKRSRLHSTTAEETGVPTVEIPQSAASDVQNDFPAPSEGSTKIPPTSGFANSSASSPFGALAGNKSPTNEPQTSASAFASSGFGALGGSSTSGFGSIGKGSGGFESGGSFATGAKSPVSTGEDSKTSAGGFGGALGQQSAFANVGAGASGFGSGKTSFASSGFGGGIGSTGFSSSTGFGLVAGSGLRSFASNRSAAPLGSTAKAARPFGAPVDNADEGDKEEDEGDDRAGAKSPLATENEKQDERFYEQELATGEEDEIMEFTSRAKLYNFAPNPANDNKKEWRERGMGVLRLNVKKALPDEDYKPTARLLMRADGSHRVLLNTPIKKELTFGTPTGDKPQGGYVYFMGTIDGGIELLQLKLKQANALDLFEHVDSLKKEM